MGESIGTSRLPARSIAATGSAGLNLWGAKTPVSPADRHFLDGNLSFDIPHVADEIRANGGTAEVATVDAADEQAVEAHAADLVERAGRIDILFNAIGLQDVQGAPLTEMTVESFTQPFAVAARTQFLTARAVGRRMAQQGKGVLLTITAEPTPVENLGGFGAACAAIEGL